MSGLLAPLATPQARHDEPRPPRARVTRDGDGSVYHRLRRIAGGVRRDERALTLGVTGLVHEALLRAGTDALADPSAHEARVCREMGRVVIDRARSRTAQKRWGHLLRARHTALDQLNVDPEHEDRAVDGLDLRLALDRLGSVSPRLRTVVWLRHELGLSEEDTASTLGVNARTVRRDSVKARGLLEHFLGSVPSRPPLD